MHNYHRQRLKFHYPILREEKQEAENFCFEFFFNPDYPAKAGPLRMAFKYKMVTKTQDFRDPDFTISQLCGTR